MSSDLFVYDNSSLFRYSGSEMEVVPSDADLQFLSETFSPFSESAIDILQAISDNPCLEKPTDEYHSVEQLSSPLLSSSPPSQQMESLRLYQATHLQFLANGSNLEYGLGKLSALDGFEVKHEECQAGSEPAYNQAFVPHSYGGFENVAKFLQRSYSSGCFDGKPESLFQPRFDALMESPNFHGATKVNPENNFFTGQMRKVCSTGDLQNFSTDSKTQRSFSSSFVTESSFMEDPNSKVGRYSAEERKERISKYRAKRTQRNFNKTIKYACRKTLADNRPRIRGRFARNDEICEIPKAACSAREEDEEDQFLVEGLHGEEEEGGTVRGQMVNMYGPSQYSQFQYYGF